MATLTEKLCALMDDIGVVGKDGKNAFHNYAYQSHAGIMAKLQPRLAKHGIVMFPETCAVLHCEVNGNTTHVIYKVVYGVTDGETTIQVTGIGEGVDKGDKASYKAQTGAHKYAIKQLLCLPDSEDPEADAKTDKMAELKAEGYKGSGQSSQKAGKRRGASLEELEHVMGDMKEKVFEKYGVASWADLPKDVAENMITKYTEIANG